MARLSNTSLKAGQLPEHTMYNDSEPESDESDSDDDDTDRLLQAYNARIKGEGEFESNLPPDNLR